MGRRGLRGHIHHRANYHLKYSPKKTIWMNDYYKTYERERERGIEIERVNERERGREREREKEGIDEILKKV